MARPKKETALSRKEITKRYNERKQAKSFSLTFRLVDDEERAMYEYLETVGNKKQFIRDLIKKHISALDNQ